VKKKKKLIQKIWPDARNCEALICKFEEILLHTCLLKSGALLQTNMGRDELSWIHDIVRI
jgi:hypothetical protein